MSEKKFYQLPPLLADLSAEEISALWEFVKMSPDNREKTQEYMDAFLENRNYKADRGINPVLDFLGQIKHLSSRIMHEICSITSYVYLQHCVYDIPADKIPACSEGDRTYSQLLTEYFDKHDQWEIIVD